MLFKVSVQSVKVPVIQCQANDRGTAPQELPTIKSTHLVADETSSSDRRATTACDATIRVHSRVSTAMSVAGDSPKLAFKFVSLCLS